MRSASMTALGTTLTFAALLTACGASYEGGASPATSHAEAIGAAGPSTAMQPVYAPSDAPQEQAARDDRSVAEPEAAAAGAQMPAASPQPMVSLAATSADAQPTQKAPAGSPRLEAAKEKKLAEGTTAAPSKPSPTASVASPPPPPAMPVAVAPPEAAGTEDYKDYGVNPVTDPQKDRFSTFAIDVDTASYAIARRKLTEGSLPPFSSVRAEEFLNSFDYGYASPKSGAFAVHLAAAPSPFAAGHHLVRVGVQGKRVSAAERKPVHLVYLVDTSGSMQADDKIGYAKESLRMLTNTLRPGDTVALCTYAGSVREVLAPTGIDNKSRILEAIDNLAAGGSTAMSSGIDLAYNLAKRTLVKGHVNRVIVLSDGDANVGPSSHTEILRQISDYRGQGITLSTVGFGMGNYKDQMMEQLADSGDGNYSYIDSREQARRVFSEDVSGMLEVIARDVKIQVEFDPSVVKSYRLIGYENRDVADKDFRNDRVDAGEIGSGHSVTAVYDVVLRSTSESPITVRVRHKEPLGSEKATEQMFKLAPNEIARTFDEAPASLRFASAVAGFAEILRQSPEARTWKLSEVERIAARAAADRTEQQELVALVRQADVLSGNARVANIAK